MPAARETQNPAGVTRQQVKRARRTTRSARRDLDRAVDRAIDLAERTSASAGGGPSRGPSEPVTRSQERAVKKAHRKAKKAQQARRDAAYAERLRKLAEREETAAQQAAKKAKRANRKAVERGEATIEPRPMTTLDIVGEHARGASAHGVLAEGGVVSKKTAGDIRALTTGSRNPSALELAIAAAPVPAFKGAKVVRTVLRGERALSTAKAAERAVKTADSLKTARKAERATARAAESSKLAKARATGKGLGKQARKRLSKTEAKAAAKRTAHRTSDKALRSATSPVVAAAAASPGDVGDKTRAFIEGTATADPRKSLATTGRAVPATLAFGATAAGDLVHAVATGDTGPLEGTAKEAGQAFKALAPLVSGDAAKVREATENDLGYVFAPLLPRGAVSRPVRAVGRGAGKAVRRVTPKRIPDGATRPTGLRSAKQIATGGRKRKSVAKRFARETQMENFRAARAAKEIEKPARKIKGARSFKNLHGVEAGDLVPVIARYGISRKNPAEQLERVVRSLDPADAGEITTVRTVAEFARKHPEALGDKNLWKAVDAAKKRLSEVETSPRAKYLAQGRVLGDITKPEERVPLRARPLTKARTRGEAWADLEKRTKGVAKAKFEARVAAGSGDGVKAVRLREQAKALDSERRELRKALKGYTKGDTPPSIRQRSRQWDRQLVDEFTEEVRAAAKKEGFEEPSWVAERTLPEEGTMGGPRLPASGTKATHIKTGKAELTDVADRSLRNLVASSVYAPRLQRALHRTIARFTTEEAIPKVINGNSRRIIKSDEAAALIREKKLDPREEVLIPARQWKKALEGEEFAQGFFSVDELYADINKRLKADLHQLEDAPGTDYVVVKREAAREFADQVNPNAGAVEKFLSATGLAGTRVILGLSPAWALAQVMAEGLQVVAAQGNPARLAKSLRALHQLKRADPEGYEAFAGYAGESVAAFDTPSSLRVEMDGGTQRSFADAGRAIRRTAVGRAMYATGTIKALGLFDRWKGGKYRSLVLAARTDQQLNGFISGLQGMLRQQDEIANKLKGKPLHEQMSWLSRNPAALAKHLDYLDDVMGNWNAFTRFERQFSPALVFYPFLRMSMRWTFWSYPLRHPVKAQMVYLLAQQNAEELEKLLGTKPKFLELAQPVLHGKSGEVEGVLPGGTRFAAPGSNVLTQAIGENNISGLARALNPLLALGYTAVSGKDPMSGEESDIPRGLLVLNQLLSMAAPARATGLNRFGKEDNPVTEAFARTDPQRTLRSLVNPFIGQSAEQAREQAKLSRTVEAAGKFDSEVGQFIKLVDAKGMEEAKRIVLADMAASDELRKLADASDPEIERIIDAYYEIKYGTGESSSTSSSRPAWMGGSASSSSKPAWMR